MAYIDCRPCVLRTTHQSDRCLFCELELTAPNFLERLMVDDEDDLVEASPIECRDPECEWRHDHDEPSQDVTAIRTRTIIKH